MDQQVLDLLKSELDDMRSELKELRESISKLSFRIALLAGVFGAAGGKLVNSIPSVTKIPMAIAHWFV